MGSKSGWAHAPGCPEWAPPGAGSREGVLGMLWWFSCPSGPMHAIPADIDSILTHTCKYIQIPTDTYIGEGAFLTPSPAINKAPISAHTIVSCIMELGGRSGKVMACPEHPGRCYGRGKTELHTSLQGKIEKSGRDRKSVV